MILTDTGMMTTPPSKELRAAWFVVRGIAAENPVDRDAALLDMKEFVLGGSNLPEPLRDVDANRVFDLVDSVDMPESDLIVPIGTVNGMCETSPVSLNPLFFHVGSSSTAHYLVESSSDIPVPAVMACYAGIKHLEVDDIIVHYRQDTGRCDKTLDDVLGV